MKQIDYKFKFVKLCANLGAFYKLQFFSVIALTGTYSTCSTNNFFLSITYTLLAEPVNQSALVKVDYNRLYFFDSR